MNLSQSRPSKPGAQGAQHTDRKTEENRARGETGYHASLRSWSSPFEQARAHEPGLTGPVRVSPAQLRVLAADLDLSAARLRAEAAELRRRADELERHVAPALILAAEGRAS